MPLIRPALLGVLALALFFSSISHAATSEFQTLLDLDNNPASGCKVDTADGPFSGVEKILVTTTDANTVLGVATRDCINLGSNEFGPPQPVDGGGWPVGEGLGDGGADVVESYLTVRGLSEGAMIRVGLVALAGDNSDAMLLNGGAAIHVRTPGAVPSLNHPALMLLTLLLALGAYPVLRSHPNVTGMFLAIVIVGGSIGVAWAAFGPDGQIDDWKGFSPLATDPRGDPEPDLVAMYGYATRGQFFFRFDAFLNTAPVANNDIYAVDEDSTLNPTAPGVLGNDTDANSDTLTAELVNGPGNTQGFSLNPDGSFSYLPNTDYYGPDSFTYRVFDGDDYSDIATVDLTINPVNDAPGFIGGADQAVAEDSDAQTVSAWATSISKGPVNESAQNLNFSIVSNTNSALFSAGPSINATSGDLTYTPATDANGSANITIELMDDGGTANGGVDTSAPFTFTITVTPTDDPVTANDDMGFSTDEDTPLTGAGNLLTNDIAPDGGLAAVAATTTSSAGAAVTIYTNGTFDYDPTGAAPLQALLLGESVNDVFSYTARDVDNDADIATVSVTVAGRNEAPAAVASPIESFDAIGNTSFQYAASHSMPAPSTFLMGNLLANFAPDPDGPNPLAASLVSATAGASVTVNVNGTFTYVSPAGHLSAKDSFDYQVTDGLDIITRTVTINLKERVWYVKNNSPAGGSGRSSDPFDTLAEAEAISGTGDYIFVYAGDGTTNGQDMGISLKNGQKLIGEAVGLTVDVTAPLNGGTATEVLLVDPGAQPRIMNTTGDGITVVASPENGPRSEIEVRGLHISASATPINVSASGGAPSDIAIDNSAILAMNEQTGIQLTGSLDAAVTNSNIRGGTYGLRGEGLSGQLNFLSNEVRETTWGLQLDYGDGSSTVDISDNLFDITADAAAGVTIDHVGSGSLVVTENRNTITITAAGLAYGQLVEGNPNDSATFSGNAINITGDCGETGRLSGQIGQAINNVNATLSNNEVTIKGCVFVVGQAFTNAGAYITSSSNNIDAMESIFQNAYGQRLNPKSSGGVTELSGNTINVVGGHGQHLDETSGSPGDSRVILSDNTITSDGAGQQMWGRGKLDLDISSINNTIHGQTGIEILFSSSDTYKRLSLIDNSVTSGGLSIDAHLASTKTCAEWRGNAASGTASVYVPDPDVYPGPPEFADVNDLAGLIASNSFGGGISFRPDSFGNTYYPNYLGVGNLCPPLP